MPLLGRLYHRWAPRWDWQIRADGHCIQAEFHSSQQVRFRTGSKVGSAMSRSIRRDLLGLVLALAAGTGPAWAGTERVSVGPRGAQSKGDSTFVAVTISADGRF